jgi:hypothetical protein
MGFGGWFADVWISCTGSGVTGLRLHTKKRKTGRINEMQIRDIHRASIRPEREGCASRPPEIAGALKNLYGFIAASCMF